MLKKCLSIGTVIVYLFTGQIGTSSVWAEELVLPKPGAMVPLSPAFDPAVIKGIKIHPDQPFQFNFLIARGEEKLADVPKNAAYQKLIKYFLASLAIPDEDQWVNLSPYEHALIIKDNFGKTEMGRDLLAQDYILKGISASLIYPEGKLGKAFWKKIYAQAQAKYGNTNVHVNTFNKVWIVPDKAVVYEYDDAQDLNAYVIESKLKVMLEEDYLSLQKNKQSSNTRASEIFRDIIIPALTHEVNTGKNFANLRQIYNAMILATWYKRTLKESILGKVYADRSKIKGIDQDPRANEEIYAHYLKAFKQGVFNFIKEDVDPLTQRRIPRKYFSGGFHREDKATTVVRRIDSAQTTAMSNEQAGIDNVFVSFDRASTAVKIEDLVLVTAASFSPYFDFLMEGKPLDIDTFDAIDITPAAKLLRRGKFAIRQGNLKGAQDYLKSSLTAEGTTDALRERAGILSAATYDMDADNPADRMTYGFEPNAEDFIEFLFMLKKSGMKTEQALSSLEQFLETMPPSEFMRTIGLMMSLLKLRSYLFDELKRVPASFFISGDLVNIVLKVIIDRDINDEVTAEAQRVKTQIPGLAQTENKQDELLRQLLSSSMNDIAARALGTDKANVNKFANALMPIIQKLTARASAGEGDAVSLVQRAVDIIDTPEGATTWGFKTGQMPLLKTSEVILKERINDQDVSSQQSLLTILLSSNADAFLRNHYVSNALEDLFGRGTDKVKVKTRFLKKTAQYAQHMLGLNIEDKVTSAIEDIEKQSNESRAMTTVNTTGGIDFKSSDSILNVLRGSKRSSDHLTIQDWSQFNTIDGLIPRIISIEPLLIVKQ